LIPGLKALCRRLKGFKGVYDKHSIVDLQRELAVMIYLAHKSLASIDNQLVKIAIYNRDNKAGKSVSS